MDGWNIPNPGSGIQNYASVAFNTPSQEINTVEFYGELINENGHPSEIFCRLSDSIFFYIQANCPEHRDTNVIEPAKIAWYTTTLTGSPRENTNILVSYLSSLYSKANIPHMYNSAGQPTLDRRGFLYYLVQSARTDPESEHASVEKVIRLFRLLDPMTGFPFPLPVPRSALPATPDPRCANIMETWVAALRADIQRKRAGQVLNPQGQSNVTSGNANQAVISQMHRNEEAFMLAARLEESRHRNAMYAIDNIGGGHRHRRNEWW
ncbi:hypothetical protein M422DRAFT_262068 [Sphaerobolus stellatus SS14]|uniref:Unplaced genomic scaffold SPHSTscaffold_111, whole genome shotgun sequence n=1 Tax=Sphaerobolus stellatus (strain SS14) TaxID=990650 RepID=A0A0C9V1U6_SPHS4|nr:hypothetical protein M422DRAFT_262068 [Sphaerobolus stellatus SS14]